MDELRRNMDGEKHTINTFCQGMQEAMAKTHATMIMEVQRQYESKERVYRSQLLILGEFFWHINKTVSHLNIFSERKGIFFN